MKLTTQQKSVLFTQKGILRTRFSDAIRLFKNGSAHPVTSYYSGGYVTTSDKSFDVELLLNTLNLKFKVGNDAPRGGKIGSFIKISKLADKKINQLLTLNN